MGRETRWTFDERGRQLTRTLPLGFGPDGIQGTADDATLPEGDFTESFEYDARGRRTLHISFEGVVTEYEYSQTTGRLDKMRFFDNLTSYNGGTGTPAEEWSYTYDAFGREVAVTQAVTGGPSRTVTKDYDDWGRLVSESSPEGVIGYSYDDLGRMIQTAVYLAGEDPTVATPQRTTSYTYDALGRLETVTEDRDVVDTTDALLTTTYQYDLVGNLDLTLLPSGVAEDYTYDSLNRLDTLTHYVTDGTLADTLDFSDDLKLAEFDYDVQADGRRTDLTETFFDASGVAMLTNTYDWTYDNLGRLVTETFSSTDANLQDYQADYTFDLTGNRLTKATDTDGDQVADETVTYTYDVNDRLLTERLDTTGDGIAEQLTTYGYTATQQTSKTVYTGDQPVAGNETSKVTFSYDLQGRMEVVVTETWAAGSVTRREQVTYDYDTRGIRVSALHEVDTDADGTWDTRTCVPYENLCQPGR